MPRPGPSPADAGQPDRLAALRERAEEIGFEVGVAEGKFYFRKA